MPSPKGLLFNVDDQFPLWQTSVLQSIVMDIVQALN